MRMKKVNQNESGRSMVEMLGVLAVVGLLSVMAFAAFRIALNKAKANSIVHDARKAWVEAVAWQNIETPTGWKVSNYASESGKTFYAMRDIKDNNYVKVEGVVIKRSAYSGPVNSSLKVVKPKPLWMH